MNTELVSKETAAVPATQGDVVSIISVIERAATNPDVDIDKFERLMAMSERLNAKNAETLFNQAMSDAQAAMRPISADATNPQTRSRYASYARLDGALRPIYTDNGFSLSFDTGTDAPQDTVRVLCYVAHRAGHSRTYHVDMPADGKGAKGGDVMTKTHATGAGMSYGMRYLLKMIFNVAVGEDDRDGNAPVDDHIGPVQAKRLDALLKKCSAKAQDNFKRMYGEPKDIKKSEYDDVAAKLEGSAARAAAGDQS
jgi:hypothetical protein